MQRLPQQRDVRVDVHSHNPVPLVRGEVADQPTRWKNAGIEHEHVETAETAHSGFERFRHRLALSDVAYEPEIEGDVRERHRERDLKCPNRQPLHPHRGMRIRRPCQSRTRLRWTSATSPAYASGDKLWRSFACSRSRVLDGEDVTLGQRRPLLETVGSLDHLDGMDVHVLYDRRVRCGPANGQQTEVSIEDDPRCWIGACADRPGAGQHSSRSSECRQRHRQRHRGPGAGCASSG